MTESGPSALCVGTIPLVSKMSHGSFDVKRMQLHARLKWTDKLSNLIYGKDSAYLN